MSSDTKAMVFLSSSILAFASKPWPREQAALAEWAVWAMLCGTVSALSPMCIGCLLLQHVADDHEVGVVWGVVSPGIDGVRGREDKARLLARGGGAEGGEAEIGDGANEGARGGVDGGDGGGQGHCSGDERGGRGVVEGEERRGTRGREVGYKTGGRGGCGQSIVF